MFELERFSRLGVSVDPHADRATVDSLASTVYQHQDEITISRSAMGQDFDDKLAMFFKEHLHDDAEVRYILDGGGYFDIRDENDKWVRLKVDQGALVMLPPGIYHRFIVDERDYVQAVRLFRDNPNWTAYPRGDDTDKMECRKAYLETLRVKQSDG